MMKFPHDIHFYFIDGNEREELGMFVVYCSYDEWPAFKKNIFRVLAEYDGPYVSFDEFQIEKDTVMYRGMYQAGH